jgi:Na+-translocating ferredoxin:NAD+ oxidoreductase RnfG subunit
MLAGVALAAPGRYMDRQQFLDQVFTGAAAEQAALPVGQELRTELEAVLGHSFNLLRIRYWRGQERTAWILDEVGKTEAITIGVGIDDGRIANLQVLEFRETRGWEVRYPFFTDQFAGARLDETGEFKRKIDGITGATLSVAAVSKVAQIALILDQRARDARTIGNKTPGS